MTVDEYIAAAGPDRQEALRALRALVREAAPEAREEIRHGMPYYDLDGDLVAFAAQKHHFSVYLLRGLLADEHRAALGKLDCGKGCIRFRTLEEAPLDVLREIVRDAASRPA